MTKVQFLLILSSIWISQGSRDKTFALGIGVFYLLVAIIMGLLGNG
jgi:hypothetical protein